LENSCFTWKRASAPYGKPSWRTAVLPGREQVHLMEDHLGEKLLASASYGRSSWRTAVLPGREPVHLMEDHLGEQLFYLEESQCILLEDHLG